MAWWTILAKIGAAASKVGKGAAAVGKGAAGIGKATKGTSTMFKIGKALGKAKKLGGGVVAKRQRGVSPFEWFGRKRDKGFYGHMKVKGLKQDSSGWAKLK